MSFHVKYGITSSHFNLDIVGTGTESIARIHMPFPVMRGYDSILLREMSTQKVVSLKEIDKLIRRHLLFKMTLKIIRCRSGSAMQAAYIVSDH